MKNWFKRNLCFINSLLYLTVLLLLLYWLVSACLAAETTNEGMAEVASEETVGERVSDEAVSAVLEKAAETEVYYYRSTQDDGGDDYAVAAIWFTADDETPVWYFTPGESYLGHIHIVAMGKMTLINPRVTLHIPNKDVTLPERNTYSGMHALVSIESANYPTLETATEMFSSTEEPVVMTYVDTEPLVINRGLPAGQELDVQGDLLSFTNGLQIGDIEAGEAKSALITFSVNVTDQPVEASMTASTDSSNDEKSALIEPGRASVDKGSPDATVGTVAQLFQINFWKMLGVTIVFLLVMLTILAVKLIIQMRGIAQTMAMIKAHNTELDDHDEMTQEEDEKT